MVSRNSRTSIVREPGEHKVTFTVTLACAVQAGGKSVQHLRCEKFTGGLSCSERFVSVAKRQSLYQND